MNAVGSTRAPQTEAKRELARRELARRRFIHFEEYVAKTYFQAARHHRLVAEYLEQVERYIATKGREGIGRLLILEPPRHGKSEQMSRHFPAWVLGRMPNTRIILASYGADLAVKFSRSARDIVRSQEFAAIFGENSGKADEPVKLSEDSQSVETWDLAAPHRGGLIATGIGGGITGSGANLFLVDDPFKNREEAESEERREKVWEWWTSTAYTRLEDGAAVIGSLTRWHGDDWAGRLLKEMVRNPKADQYVILCLPALAEADGPALDSTEHINKLLDGVFLNEHDPLGRPAGRALWPEKYDEPALEKIKMNIGEYDFAALYDQSPYSRSGNMFKREWFTIVEAAPETKQIAARIRYWDKAGSKKGTGDFTVGVLMDLTVDGVVYVEHVDRSRGTPGQREEQILRIAEADRLRPGPQAVIWHQQDPGTAGLDSAENTSKNLVKHEFTVLFETVSGDKTLRAGPWSSACQAGMVRLVRGAWNDGYIEEHVAFPKGKYDDQVDVSSTGFSKLMRQQLWVAAGTRY